MITIFIGLLIIVLIVYFSRKNIAIIVENIKIFVENIKEIINTFR